LRNLDSIWNYYFDNKVDKKKTSESNE